MGGVIRKATIDDAEHVTALRRSVYAGSRELSLLPLAMVAWGPDDERGVVLVAESADGTIVSTMRGQIFTDTNEFLGLFGLDVSSMDLPLPTLHLERAATHVDSRRCGLNSVLRSYFLRLAAESGVESVSGFVYAGASRTKVMTDLGYRFAKISAKQFRGEHPEGYEDESLAVLLRSQLASACQLLIQQTKGETRQWPWSGPAILALDSPIWKA